MHFEINTWTIGQLFSLLEEGKIELKPPYQRNFIWTPSEQQDLIESICSNYPLPSFFLFKRHDGILDMVDGQQRTRTIFRFIKNLVADKQKRHYSEDSHPHFLTFSLSITVITALEEGDSLEIFYARVNKTGKRLNDAELNKAEFYNTNFLKLVEELTEFQNFKDLDLFRDITIIRMNDRDFVEEIVTLMLLKEFTDKKIARDRVFVNDITEEKSAELTIEFKRIIGKLEILNAVYPINKTRYRQKNDFYTLYAFIYFHPELDDDSLKYFYHILRIIGKSISPSIDGSEYLKEYAIHCVSQSNSKNARERRYDIISKILLGNDKEPNIVQLDVLGFYQDKYSLNELNLVKINNYFTFDLNHLSKAENIHAHEG